MSSQYSTHLSTPKGWKADINNITPGCWLLLLLTALLTEREASTPTSDFLMTSPAADVPEIDGEVKSEAASSEVEL